MQGASHDEIVNAVHVDVQNPATATKIKQLLAATSDGRNGYCLNITQELLVRYDFPIQQSFRIKAQDIFSAKISAVDFGQFTQSNSKTKNLVNRKEKSKDLENLKIVMLSHFDFNSGWTTPFNLKKTKKDEFTYLSDSAIEEIINVDVMTSEKMELECGHVEQLNSQVLRLPLAGNNASLVIVLPHKLRDMKKLESIPERVFIKHSLQKQTVIVRLPKFFITSVNKNYDTSLKKVSLSFFFYLSSLIIFSAWD